MARGSGDQDQAEGRLTKSGALLATALLLITASAVPTLRLNVAGMQVHLYLLLLLPLLVFFCLPRASRLPPLSLAAASLFLILYTAAATVTFNDLSLGEVFKTGAGMATLAGAALAVRSRRDSQLAILALCVAVALISLRGLAAIGELDASGVNPMQGIGNKNVYSLYALPALMLGGYIVFVENTARWMRVVIYMCCLIIIVTTFSTGNRSGMLGAILVVAMLVRVGLRRRALRRQTDAGDERPRRRSTLVFAAVLFIGGVLGGLVYLNSFASIDHRLQRTLDGYHSDQKRLDAAVTSVQIGLEYPVLGVGPGPLRFHVGERMEEPAGYLDPHNLVAHIAGGSGLITLGALIFLGWTLWRRPRQLRTIRARLDGPDPRVVHTLLRMILILWVIRGMFTREILYSPSFNAGVGITIGLCVQAGVWRRTPRTEPAPAKTVRPA